MSSISDNRVRISSITIKLLYFQNYGKTGLNDRGKLQNIIG